MVVGSIPLPLIEEVIRYLGIPAYRYPDRTNTHMNYKNLRSKLQRFDAKLLGYICLDYFTRTWVAFWGTLAFVAGYILWQHLVPTHKFDNFPYLGLCTVVTLLSYFQNIIIMTIQREDHEIQQRLEALEAARDQKVFEMVEDIHEELVEEHLGGVIGLETNAGSSTPSPGDKPAG